MANVMFKKGLLASLPSTYAEGTFYVTTDERAIYLDVNDTTRIRLGDFQEFATLAELQANPNPSTTALYFVTELNCLVKYNGTAYVQINRDTGMTSVEVVGEGNAVTAAVYDAEGRKLTLTKGATYATPAEVDAKIKATVGEIPADSEGAAQTVRQYIDAKTDGIASDEALSQLTERVGTAEDEIDALQEKVGEKAVGTQITEAIDALKLGETYEAKGAAKAVQGETTSTVKDVEDSLNTYKTNNDTAVAAAEKTASDALGAAKTELEGKIADAQAAAEKVANDHNTAMDTRMQAVEGKAHEHANKAELDKIADGDKAKWDAASAKAHEHANATTLAGVTDEKVAAWDAAESNAKAYTDAALTWGSF